MNVTTFKGRTKLDIVYFKVLPASKENTDKTSTRMKIRAILKDKKKIINLHGDVRFYDLSVFLTH